MSQLDSGADSSPILPERSSDDQPRRPRPSFETLIGRALRLRCPGCGEGALFKGLFTMPERCAHCGLKFERAPGYYLGSAYFNYGCIALLSTVTFMVLRFGIGIPTSTLKYPLFGVALVLPLITFRHARALWLAMDCHFDHSVLDEETAGEGDH